MQKGGQGDMYRKPAEGWLRNIDFMLLDLVCLELSFFASYLIRHGLQNPYMNPLYRNEAIVFALLQVLISFVEHFFEGIFKRGYYLEFVASLKHTCLVILSGAFFLFAIQEGQDFSRVVLILTGVLYMAAGYATRVLWKQHVKSEGSIRKRKRSMLLVTVREMAEASVEGILGMEDKSIYLTGMVLLDRDMRGKEISGIPVVGNRESLTDYVCREWVDEVFVNLPFKEGLPPELRHELMEMGVAVHLTIAKSMSMKGQKHNVEDMGGYTVLTSSINVISWKESLYKRTLDIMGGLVGCLLTAALTVFIAPAIYIKSPGPIYFSQIRVGKNGKKFRMYKFRSMYVDAEERKKEYLERNQVKDGLMFKLKNDPRIIGGEKGKGIGNFIRRYSIDEFPQFFNVLKGDMSLVGTRPPTVDEWEKYDLHHRARMAIKPGITGLWQVSGRSGITDFEEVVRLDTEYIENWSIGLDLRILLKTVGAVVKGSGAM